MIDEVLIFGLVVVLSAALPLSIIAALGFHGSPFGKVTAPIPIIIFSYVVADGSRLYMDHVPATFYAVFTSVAVAAAVYSAVNAALLLTERRSV